ncbi:TonB-dependent receptor [Gayadomonas joobiniege]|uniref:TonB-dependent receptor n=1 Tax=Gayadomonas joobiniege TaxID=1234606 RepID=UPI0003699FFD|nr:TonB-dependent receptor [Gayadomonas joobiniege]
MKKIITLSLLSLAVSNAIAADKDISNHGVIEEMVVSGQRLARLKSLEVKKNSVVVMDAMSADNLGRLPDKNAAESINRLPGVSVLIEKGEGRFASIRGIKPEWNQVTINGFEIGSPEKDGSGRQMPLDVLGGELLQSVEVYKAKTADMDGQGIGGTVNIVTKKPLQGKDFQGTVNIRLGLEEADQDNPFYERENPYNIDAAVSGKLSPELGYIVAASKTHRQYLAQGIYQDDWKEVAGIAYPEQSKNNYYVVGRDRTTLTAGLEYQAADHTNLLLQAFYSEFEEFQHRNRFRQGVEQDAGLISNVTEDGFDVAQGATFIRGDLRREDVTKEVNNISLSGETKWQSWLFDYGINLGQNKIVETNSAWDFRQDTSQGLGPDSVSFSRDGILQVSEGGLTHNLPENLRFNTVQYQNDQSEQDIFSAKFNAEYAYLSRSFEGAVKFGVKYTQNEKSFDLGNDEYDVTRNNIAGFNVDRGDFINDVNGEGRKNVWFDLYALNQLFNDQPELFTFDQTASEQNKVANDKKVEETTTAAYLMNTLQIDKWQVITGLRIEQTDVESVGQQAVADDYQSVSVSGSDHSVLPSILVNYRPVDDLIVRGSWTESLGRPNYADISATSTYQVNEDGDGVLNIGNPDLKAYQSSNLDLSVEWYPTDASVISLAWFNKTIDNLIVNNEQTINSGSFQGTEYAVDKLLVNTKRNADNADVEGYELNIQYQFVDLPKPFDGLGATYSYTSIDATFYDSEIGEARTLEGQPEEIQSFTLFFENYDWYLGLTYNYNAAFLTDMGDIAIIEDDVTQGEFGRWDFRASYYASDSFTVYVDINNLNNEPTTEYQGGLERWNTEYEYVGSTYYAGFTYAF